MNSAKRCGKRVRGLSLLLAVTLFLAALTGCGSDGPEESAAASDASASREAPAAAAPTETREAPRPQPRTEAQTEPRPEETQEEPLMKLAIDGTELEVLWEDNESVAALRSLAAEAPLTIEMSPYGGFEQVGPIGQSLPRNDAQTVTEPGDLVLYAGNQIVVFYGSNSWAYTRLGRIRGLDQAELSALLGNGADSGKKLFSEKRQVSVGTLSARKSP